MSRYHQRRQWFLRNGAIAAGYNNQKDEIERETVEEAEASDGPHVIDLFEDMSNRREFKTAKAVDAYIREERDSLDR